MEELREKLNVLVELKGPLDEETLYISRKMDKLLLNYYKEQSDEINILTDKISA